MALTHETSRRTAGLASCQVLRGLPDRFSCLRWPRCRLDASREVRRLRRTRRGESSAMNKVVSGSCRPLLRTRSQMIMRISRCLTPSRSGRLTFCARPPRRVLGRRIVSCDRRRLGSNHAALEYLPRRTYSSLPSRLETSLGVDMGGRKPLRFAACLKDKQREHSMLPVVQAF